MNLQNASRTFIIDLGPFIGIDRDDMIHIQQALITFHQNFELEDYLCWQDRWRGR